MLSLEIKGNALLKDSVGRTVLRSLEKRNMAVSTVELGYKTVRFYEKAGLRPAPRVRGL